MRCQEIGQRLVWKGWNPLRYWARSSVRSELSAASVAPSSRGSRSAMATPASPRRRSRRWSQPPAACLRPTSSKAWRPRSKSRRGSSTNIRLRSRAGLLTPVNGRQKRYGREPSEEAGVPKTLLKPSPLVDVVRVKEVERLFVRDGDFHRCLRPRFGELWHRAVLAYISTHVQTSPIPGHRSWLSGVRSCTPHSDEHGTVSENPSGC